jgi:hypothetical protein
MRERTQREKRRALTVEEILALPAAVDLETAGRAFGLGRTKAGQLARKGEFPCQVLRLGRSYRVPRSAILQALGIPDQPRAAEPVEAVR